MFWTAGLTTACTKTIEPITSPGLHICSAAHEYCIAGNILAGIKFGGWALNRHCKGIGGFKFGSLVRDCHTYICKYEILVDFNLAVAS